MLHYYSEDVATQMPFDDTHWSLVLRAGKSDDGAREALETLCRQYWPPLYSFLRAKGYQKEQAEDILQGFFVHILERNAIDRADPEAGRFRTYLLTILSRFAGSEWARSRTLKRGGGIELISMDTDGVEAIQNRITVKSRTPEEIFEHQWAMNVLGQAMERLADYYGKSGKQHLFETLRPALVAGEERGAGADVGQALGMSTGAVRVAVHRLRARFRETLAEVVAETVGSPEDVQAELQSLFEILGRR